MPKMMTTMKPIPMKKFEANCYSKNERNDLSLSVVVDEEEMCSTSTFLMEFDTVNNPFDHMSCILNSVLGEQREKESIAITKEK